MYENERQHEQLAQTAAERIHGGPAPGQYSGAARQGLAPRDKSASPIRDQMSATEQLLSDVYEGIIMLEERLETILTPIPPQPDGTRGNAQTGPPISHVAGRLEILNDGYRQASQRLRVLVQRIEL